jgi:hypothetical protein
LYFFSWFHFSLSFVCIHAPVTPVNSTYLRCLFIFAVLSETPRSRIRVVVTGPGADADAEGALRPAYAAPTIDRSLLSPGEDQFFDRTGEVTSVDDTSVSLTIRMDALRPGLSSLVNDADARQFFATFPDALPARLKKSMVSNTLATDQDSLRSTWEGLSLEASPGLV